MPSVLMMSVGRNPSKMRAEVSPLLLRGVLPSLSDLSFFCVVDGVNGDLGVLSLGRDRLKSSML